MVDTMTSATMARPRRLRGVALTGDVTSKNGRWYSLPTVQAACAEAQERVRTGRFLCFTHHQAASEDDVTRVVGAVRELWMNGKQLHYMAELVDTQHGRDVWTLATGPTPLISVSIRGEWIGPVVEGVGVDGQRITYGRDGLRLIGLDTTSAPGVDTASTLAEAYRELPRTLFEQVSAHAEDSGGPVDAATDELHATLSRHLGPARATAVLHAGPLVDMWEADRQVAFWDLLASRDALARDRAASQPGVWDTWADKPAP